MPNGSKFAGNVCVFRKWHIVVTVPYKKKVGITELNWMKGKFTGKNNFEMARHMFQP
jgi:hypothetical protein